MDKAIVVGYPAKNVDGSSKFKFSDLEMSDVRMNICAAM